jgi:hypothetical protein
VLQSSWAGGGLGGAMELLGGGRWRVLDDVVLSGRKKKVFLKN